jgi:flap endonuclease-1
MGVKGLQKIINHFASESIAKKEFKDFRGSTKSMDAAITLYKFCIALMNTKHFATDQGVVIGHLFACFFKSLSMLKYGIMPLWVFDGTPPVIKQATLNERRKIKDNATNKLTHINLPHDEKVKLIKRTFSVSSKHIEEIKYLLNLMGLNYVDAPGEAEAQCAALDKATVTDGVVTEDWDVILFGCKKMLKDFSNKSLVTEIDVAKMMTLLGMNREQLIDLGSILGNDYCNGIAGIKPLDAYTKFKLCDYNMEKFLESLKNDTNQKNKYKIPEKFKNDWKLAKEYYLHAPVLNPVEVNIIWNEPNYAELKKYLIDIKKLNNYDLVDKINDLKLLYDEYIKNDCKLLTLSKIKNNARDYNYPSRYEQIIRSSATSRNSQLKIKPTPIVKNKHKIKPVDKFKFIDNDNPYEIIKNINYDDNIINMLKGIINNYEYSKIEHLTNQIAVKT